MRFLHPPARGALTAIDATATRLYGWAWNPVFQAGTLAIAMLLVLLVTGLYLVIFYRLGSPWASVSRIAADPWLGSWIRSLHRYASDVFLVAGALHLLRMFAQGRSWGPRTLAWVSGIVLFGAGLACAWTGFVMAWDTFGERLARDAARLLDVLPALSEPLGRIFAGEGPVPSAFFFVNLFIHLAVPLAMGAMLWLHVSRVARPALLPPRRVMWTAIAALTGAAVLWPATLGPSANPLLLPASTPLDLVTAWWLPLSEHLSPGAAWLLLLGAVVALVTVPFWTRRPREGRLAPSAVDPRSCVGCDQCRQDCPWEAISLVPRDDDRPTLVADVDPARCVSCGICAGSCAPMGIGPPGRTGRDQIAAARVAVSDWPTESGTFAAIACERTPAAHLAAFRARGARLLPVSCVGNLHSSVIELLLRGGARGVLVAACPPRDCVNREGPKWLQERTYNNREAELQARVDRRRVRIATVAPGNLGEAIAAVDAFARELEALSVPPREADAEPETLCEPESAAGAT